MNYLVISPYYPQNFQQFTIELANKGITVLGIGQEPYEQLDEPLRWGHDRHRPRRSGPRG